MKTVGALIAVILIFIQFNDLFAQKALTEEEKK